jgi:response regulator of citrate/malate metabolism
MQAQKVWHGGRNLNNKGGTVRKGVTLPATISKRADLRVQRVIKCLRLLERSCYSADDLAEHFHISKRTVYRDLHLLAAAGVMLVKRTDDRRYFAPAEPPGELRMAD